MKRKLTIIGIVTLVLVIIAMWAVPAFADAGIEQGQNPKIQRPLLRLLLVQDEAKVDGYIATAVTNGKLTADQAVKVKAFWVTYHTKFTRKVVLSVLLKAKDQTKVQVYLDKQVAAGKIQQAQADKVIQIWKILHTTAPTAAN
ncbi:MAG: hypothetical protein PHE50_03780 [Dehalococcoidales bacterium]|nr:hypothetical protein [Dehalococcoidales bacterium]